MFEMVGWALQNSETVFPYVGEKIEVEVWRKMKDTPHLLLWGVTTSCQQKCKLWRTLRFTVTNVTTGENCVLLV